MVNCVHRCLENVNLCHLCIHDRDCNDSVGERVESIREMGRDQRGIDGEGAVFRVHFDEVFEDECFVLGGLYQRVE